MNCNACKEVLNSRELLKCRLCIGKFHYQCLNLDKQQFSALTKEYKSTWICPNCSNVTRRGRSNDNTPVRQGTSKTRFEDPMNMSCDVSDHNITSPSPSPIVECSSICLNTNTEVTMDKISTLLDEKLSASLSVFMNSFRKAIREDVKEMVKSEMDTVIKNITDDFSVTTDFICAEQTSLRTEIEKNTNTIKKLESEKSHLQTEVVKLNSRLAGIEKISRSCNIELQAVPERKNENVILLLKKLCDVIKVPLEDGHISACRRVAKLNPASNRPRNIVVTLSTPRLRDLVLSATHRYNKTHSGLGLTSADLDISGETCKIFVTEHLSPEQKTLHAAARRAAKEVGYKFVWIRYGQIYVRRNESSSAVLIKSMDCLDKLRH